MFTYIITAFVIIILIILYRNPIYILSPFYKNTSYLQSSRDNHYYHVINTFDNKHNAANKLSMLNTFNTSLIDYITEKCNNYLCNNVQNKIQKNLSRRYSPNSLIENNPYNTEETAYSQFKGKILAFCLRNRNNNELLDNNILQFVDLHELAHVASNSYGHGDEFWNVFKQLLVEAKESNLYIPIDYSKYPANYCGLSVTYNPYFD